MLHDGSSCDFHLMIKHLTKISDSSNFQCLGENAKKYMTFQPIKKKKSKLIKQPKRNLKKTH